MLGSGRSVAAGRWRVAEEHFLGDRRHVGAVRREHVSEGEAAAADEAHAARSRAGANGRRSAGRGTRSCDRGSRRTAPPAPPVVVCRPDACRGSPRRSADRRTDRRASSDGAAARPASVGSPSGWSTLNQATDAPAAVTRRAADLARGARRPVGTTSLHESSTQAVGLRHLRHRHGLHDRRRLRDVGTSSRRSGSPRSPGGRRRVSWQNCDRCGCDQPRIEPAHCDRRGG